jgi:hypothetical protein
MSALALYALSRISIRTGLSCFPSFLSAYLSFFFFTFRGNWSVDLQAGSDYGYKLLFVVLLAGLFAVILQVIFFVSVPRC